MKFKKLIVLLAVLGVLAAATAVKKSREAGPQGSVPLPAERVLPDGFSLDFIHQIRISQGADQEIILQKRDDGEWFLPNSFGARARRSGVEALAKALSELKGEVRSETAEVLADYGLTDEKAVRIRVFGAGEKEMAHVLVSTLRSARDMNFVRVAGSDKVFAASPDVLSELEIYEKDAKTSAGVFTDLQIVKVDLSSIKRLEIAGSAPVALVKNGGEWSFDPPSGDVDQGKAASYLSTIANSYASAAADPALPELAATKPVVKIESAKDGKPIVTEIIIGGENKERKSLYLKVIPDSLAYEVGEPVILGLRKDKDHFLKPRST